MQEDGLGSYRRYLQGDRAALEPLVETYSDALVRYASYYVRSAAEDIAEDAFVALILKRKQFREEGELKAYLFRIARNKCFDHLRRAWRTAPLGEELPSADFESTIEERDRKKALYAAMGRIEAGYRDVLLLVYIEGFSVEECTGILKKSRKQVYNLLARGKAALKKQLIKEGYHDAELS